MDMLKTQDSCGLFLIQDLLPVLLDYVHVGSVLYLATLWIPGFQLSIITSMNKFMSMCIRMLKLPSSLPILSASVLAGLNCSGERCTCHLPSSNVHFSQAGPVSLVNRIETICSHCHGHIAYINSWPAHVCMCHLPTLKMMVLFSCMDNVIKRQEHTFHF